VDGNADEGVRVRGSETAAAQTAATGADQARARGGESAAATASTGGTAATDTALVPYTGEAESSRDR
jgi:hypothetical protein